MTNEQLLFCVCVCAVQKGSSSVNVITMDTQSAEPHVSVSAALFVALLPHQFV